MGNGRCAERGLSLRERLLKPRLEAQGEAFGHALMQDPAAAIERDGLDLMAHCHPDAYYMVAFAVDVGPTVAILPVGLINGSVDARSLAVALTVYRHLPEARAHAI